MQVKLKEADTLALQEFIPVISDSASNNKRLPDGNRKDPITNDKTIVFPAFDLSTKRVGFGNGNARVSIVAYKFVVTPITLHF